MNMLRSFLKFSKKASLEINCGKWYKIYTSENIISQCLFGALNKSNKTYPCVIFTIFSFWWPGFIIWSPPTSFSSIYRCLDLSSLKFWRSHVLRPEFKPLKNGQLWQTFVDVYTISMEFCKFVLHLQTVLYLGWKMHGIEPQNR